MKFLSRNSLRNIGSLKTIGSLNKHKIHRRKLTIISNSLNNLYSCFIINMKINSYWAFLLSFLVIVSYFMRPVPRSSGGSMPHSPDHTFWHPELQVHMDYSLSASWFHWNLRLIAFWIRLPLMLTKGKTQKSNGLRKPFDNYQIIFNEKRYWICWSKSIFENIWHINIIGALLKRYLKGKTEWNGCFSKIYRLLFFCPG